MDFNPAALDCLRRNATSCKRQQPPSVCVRPMKLLILSLFAAIGMPIAMAVPSTVEQRALDTMFSKIETADARLDARSIMKYILEAAVVGENEIKLGKAIQTLRDQQELRQGDVNFGNFRWYRGQPEVRDRNAVQFVNQNAMALALGHPGILNAANEASFRALMTDAAQGTLNQKVNPDYTNIYLMKAANLVLLGQYLEQPKLSQQGRTNLRDWFNYAKLNGITEFNSTTYTGVDMDCAISLVRLAKDPLDQELGRAILQMLWTEVASNWFAPAQRLGGSHSRDYNYLLGIGSLDIQLAANGWLPADKPDALATEATSRIWLAPKSWTDPLRAIVPREVIQRWGSGLGQTATHWVTQDYCIGTCGRSKAYDDKVFAMQFPGDRLTPMVYYVMDARNDPYGISKESDSNGHSKTLHLRPNLGSVQKRDRVLLLAADDTEQPKHLRPLPELRGLWSHWVFPADATVHYADGSIVPPGPLAPDKAIFIWKSGVVLGLRIHEARKDWHNNTRLAVNLIRDGNTVHAARLTVEHGTGPHPGQGLVAFTAEAALAADHAALKKFAASFSTYREHFVIDDKGTAEIRVGETERMQTVALDLKQGRAIKLEGGNDLPTENVLTVNGRELWQPIIAQALREAGK